VAANFDSNPKFYTQNQHFASRATCKIGGPQKKMLDNPTLNIGGLLRSSNVYVFKPKDRKQEACEWRRERLSQMRRTAQESKGGERGIGESRHCQSREFKSSPASGWKHSGNPSVRLRAHRFMNCVQLPAGWDGLSGKSM